MKDAQKPKKKRVRLPEGAIEVKLLLVRDSDGNLEVDPSKLRVRPSISPQVMVEAVDAVGKWAKFVNLRLRVDKSMAPYITEAVENAGARLTQVAVGAVFDRLMGRRAQR